MFLYYAGRCNVFYVVLCCLCCAVMCYAFYVVLLCALLCCDLPLRVTTSARTTNEDSVILVLYGHCWEGSDITCQKRTEQFKMPEITDIFHHEFMKSNNSCLIGNAYTILA